MRKAVVLAFVLTLVGGVLTPVLADYYNTKSDFRQGRLTPSTAAPKTGTDDCVSPTAIATTPFADTGDSTGAIDDVSSIPGTCNGNYSQVAGGDHIYMFTAAAGNSLSFTLSTASQTFDPSIYVLSTCGDGLTCVQGAAADNCFANDSGQPGTCQGTDSTETFVAPEFTPGTYFFYVDSFYSVATAPDRGSGPYNVTVSGSLPAELIEFNVE